MTYAEQFRKLLYDLPKPGMWNLENENSDYGRGLYRCKNCYISFESDFCQDCYYVYDGLKNKSCVDCTYLSGCELCYHCIDCTNCYNCNFCQDCKNCSDVSYGFNLTGCKNCIACVNLIQQEYCILNKKVSKTEFEGTRKKIQADPAYFQEKIKPAYQKLSNSSPRLFSHQFKTENCMGDYLVNSKNCVACFDVENGEDSFYCDSYVKNIKDCVDISTVDGMELCYECEGGGAMLYNSNFCVRCVNCRDLELCTFVFNSNYCFLCTFLSHKEYHILNQPYSQEEYFRKVAEIKTELQKEGKYNLDIFAGEPM